MGLLQWLFGRGGGAHPPLRTLSPPPPLARAPNRPRPTEQAPSGRLNLQELARRLGVTPQELRAFRPSYRRFSIRKRSGGTRTILAPDAPLKLIQRKVLRRVLGRLRAHPAARGFERGQSILTNALPHVGKGVVLRMDLEDFFTSTKAPRIEAYFRHIGWEAEPAGILAHLCTCEDSLPQGAPTSPRLSNLVNYALDARLAAAAAKLGCDYTRYADDITFSGPARGGTPAESGGRINQLIWLTKRILSDFDYLPHLKKKLQIRRRHQRQQVTGLVVNDRVNLPRTVRRRLRAIEHHMRTGRPATLSTQQLSGWRALRSMVDASLCPRSNCRAVSPAGATFCRRCGQKLAEPT